MASTSITTVGGVVVVTQVIPKDDASIPMQTPQAPPPARSSPPPPKVDNMTAVFLQGAPQQLGVVQIMAGLLLALFSLTAISSWDLILMAPLALSLTFIVSGSLAVPAGRRPTVQWMWASLLSHLFSVVVALVGVAYLCWLLVSVQPSALLCHRNDFTKFSAPDVVTETCRSKLFLLDRVMYGVWGLSLVLMVLQVCVSITVCVFCGKALKLRSRYTPVQGATEDCNTLLSP